MIRKSISVFTGVVLSFVLNFAGSRLVWFLIIGNVERSENKDAIVRCMLWQTFGAVPAVVIAVGAFVGFIVRRSAWWLGGVAVLPLIAYGIFRRIVGIEVVFSVVYVTLAFAAAFVVARFKRPTAD